MNREKETSEENRGWIEFSSRMARGYWSSSFSGYWPADANFRSSRSERASVRLFRRLPSSEYTFPRTYSRRARTVSLRCPVSVSDQITCRIERQQWPASRYGTAPPFSQKNLRKIESSLPTPRPSERGAVLRVNPLTARDNTCTGVSGHLLYTRPGSAIFY